MSTTEAKVVLSVIDRITRPIAAIQRRIEAITAPVRRVARAIADVGRAAGIERLTGRVTELGNRLHAVGGIARGLLVPLGLLAGVGLGFGVKDLVSTNAQFEKFGTVLETVLKSPAKAKAALDWISTFAAKTPYELSETTDAFVKLTTYGIEPMRGTLLSAGNAAAAMGKPLNQAVEAVADAMTGENERLKEFGITASKAGDKIKYSWVENGKQMTAFAKKNSRKQIEDVITGIWNRQYQGAMDKLSTTWDGMVSNLKDQWSRFMQIIGKAGFFDYIKNRLSSLLDYVNGLAESGRLAEIGKQISDGIVSGLKAVEAAFHQVDWSAVWSGIKQGWEVVQGLGRAFMWFAGIVGGPVNAIVGILGAITLAPLAGGLISIATAAAGVAAALWGTPVGWFLGAVAGIAAAAYLIYQNWEPIKAFFEDLWASVRSGFASVGAALSEAWNGPSRLIGGLRTAIALVDSLTSGIARGIAAAANWLSGLFPSADAFAASAPKPESILSGYMAAVRSTVGQILSLNGQVAQAIDSVTDGIAVGIAKATTAVETVTGVIARAIDVAAGFVDGLTDRIARAIKVAADFTGGLFPKLEAPAVQADSRAGAQSPSRAQLAPGGRAADAAPGGLFSSVASGLDSVTDRIAQGIARATSVVDTLTSGIALGISAAVSAVQGLTDGLAQGIATVSGAVDSVTSGIASGIAAAVELIQGIPTAWRAVSDFLAHLPSAVIAAAGAVRGAVDAAVTDLIASVTSIGPRLLEVGRGLVASLADGIKSQWAELAAWLREAVSGLASILPEWLRGRLGFGGGADRSSLGPKPLDLPTASVTPNSQPGAATPWTPPRPTPLAMPGAGASGGGGPAAAAPAPVPVVTQQSTNVDVDAAATVSANFNWSNTEAVLNAVKALMNQYEARQRAAIASALAD